MILLSVYENIFYHLFFSQLPCPTVLSYGHVQLNEGRSQLTQNSRHKDRQGNQKHNEQLSARFRNVCRQDRYPVHTARIEGILLYEFGFNFQRE